MADGEVFDDDNVWYAADAIPNGTAAALALLEHRWAIPLRGAIARAGGYVLADEWIHAKDLIAIGLMAAAESEPEAEPAGTRSPRAPARPPAAYDRPRAAEAVSGRAARCGSRRPCARRRPRAATGFAPGAAPGR